MVGTSFWRERASSTWQFVGTGSSGLREPSWAEIQAGTCSGLRLRVPGAPSSSLRLHPAPAVPQAAPTQLPGQTPSRRPTRPLPAHPQLKDTDQQQPGLRTWTRFLSVLFFFFNPADFFPSLPPPLYLLIPNEEKVY